MWRHDIIELKKRRWLSRLCPRWKLWIGDPRVRGWQELIKKWEELQETKAWLRKSCLKPKKGILSKVLVQRGSLTTKMTIIMDNWDGGSFILRGKARCFPSTEFPEEWKEWSKESNWCQTNLPWYHGLQVARKWCIGCKKTIDEEVIRVRSKKRYKTNARTS